MTHGTYTTYQNHGCRCDECKKANHEHYAQHRRWYYDLTKEQRRHCLICGVALAVHPIRACWREV